MSFKSLKKYFEALRWPQIGDEDEGGVYVGKSPSTGNDLHVALADEPKYLTLDETLKVVSRLQTVPGHENARLPTPEELSENILRNSEKGALRGTFHASHSFLRASYRTEAPDGTAMRGISGDTTGTALSKLEDLRLPVRLVW